MSAVQIHLAGDWSSLGALEAALAACDELELADAGSAEAVLLATRDDGVPRDELDQVRRAVAAPVLLLTAYPSDALLDAAEAFGIRDVLQLPLSAGAIAFAVRKVTRATRPADTAPQADGPSRVVTVFSPKGGTGKTVTSCNLAAAAAAAGKRVLLLDLDLQFGDTSIMLGLEPRKTVFDLVSDPGSLDADKLRGYVTRSPIGVDVLPAPLKPEDAERVSEERIAQLIDVPTLKNLRLTLHTLELLGHPSERTRIVLNRADPRVGLKAGEVGAVLGHAIDFTLPNDPAVPAAVNRAIPVVAARTRCAYSQAFAPMAVELLGEPVVSRRPRLLARALGRR